MKVHGITFTHRRPGLAEASLEYAQFTAFASLCAHRRVASLVRGVFFDSNPMIFNIDVVPGAEGGLFDRLIKRCAEQSLPQFVLFDTYGLWDRAQPSGSADYSGEECPF